MNGLAAAMTSNTLTALSRSSGRIYLFFKHYEPSNEADLEKFQNDFKAMVWSTYRRGFFPLHASSFTYTTDAGWGCMLRSAQMILAEALQRHLGIEWRYKNRRHKDLLRWFIDAPKFFSFYSIHRMTECGRTYGKIAGEWYGPSTVALVLRDLVKAHRAVKDQTTDTPKGLEMIVVDDGTIYVDFIREVCEGVSNETQEKKADPLLNPGNPPLWSQALFILGMCGLIKGMLHDYLKVPVRLGLQKVNEEYLPGLIEILKFPQCVGMIGGRPSHSLYFIGSQDTKLFYLDPHTIKQIPSELSLSSSDFPDRVEIESYHCPTIKYMPAKDIDPSLAIGFYCASANEFVDLRARIGQLSRVGPTFISVQEERPRYREFYVEDLDDEESLDTASEGIGERHESVVNNDDEFVLL